MENYDNKPKSGRLVFNLHPEENYYILVSQPANPGEYIEVQQGAIVEQSSKHIIKAEPKIVIIRDKLMRKLGGLDNVVKQIKEGTFRLERLGGDQ